MVRLGYESARMAARVGGGTTASLLCAAARALRRELAGLSFAPPVACVYDPTTYARRAHEDYLRRYGGSVKRVVFLGMNPGPFGMAQTGVPFGDVGWVRDWLGIRAQVERPAHEHPKRPVLGFDCPRREVSGTRLWGAIADRFGTPERFFAGHFVANYCPLAFVEASGRNRTPDKLSAAERAALFAACDRHLRRVVSLLAPEWVVGIGAFAAARAREALPAEVRIAQIAHPSPANPRAAKNWDGDAVRALRAQGVCRAKARRRLG
jgi:single-strand selective monofunctional uracil DNA glycosylase